MFGLMRFRCGPVDEDHRRWRMHYCGTCKTLGSRYGQRARLFLNHDAAFLAELLDALTAGDCEQWAHAYRSWNCLRLPDDQEIPPVLRYTAAINVLLGEYKVRDHELDSGKRRWVWLRHWFSPAFHKAQTDLAALAFPVSECDRILRRQAELEAMPEIGVEAVAEPTARVTALVFRHGARLANLESQANAIEDIGYRFGRLIYLLDAWQDYDRDLRSGEFNPLKKIDAGRDWGERQIRTEAAEITAALNLLGSPLEFRFRLRANIEAALGTQLRVLQTCTKHASPAFGTRWREAVKRVRGWQVPAVAFALVLIVALLFPRHARLARSSRECLSLGLNLMALSTMSPVPGSGGRPRRSVRCCPSWCDKCACCCEGCECGECCCAGGCDLCSGACDCCSGC